MLFWWLIGVKNEQDAPIATAIRKGSTLICNVWAILIEMGAMTTAVAALFMRSDSIIVMINIKAIKSMGELGPAMKIKF